MPATLGKDPFAQDLTALVKQIETATFDLMRMKHGVATGFALQAPKEQHPLSGSYNFHEIDFLLLKGKTPMIFGEVKHTYSPKQACKTARKQLQVRLNLAKQNWAEVSGLIVCYFFESLYKGEFPPQLNPPESIQLAIDSAEAGELTALILSADELFKELESSGLNGQHLHDEFIRTHALFDNPMAAMKPHDTQFSNPLGDAFDTI